MKSEIKKPPSMQLWVEYYPEPFINYHFFALLYYLDQDSGSIRSSCHIMPPKCSEKPCMHGGKCIEGWNRFICDCSSTSFTGPTCGRGMQRFFSSSSFLLQMQQLFLRHCIQFISILREFFFGEFLNMFSNREGVFGVFRGE